MARVSKKDKEALKQLYVTIINEINRRHLMKRYGSKRVNVQVEVVETIRSDKHRWLGKLARLWDVKKTTYEDRTLMAFLRDDSANIALQPDGTILTARNTFRPFSEVSFDTMNYLEYRRLFQYGTDWLMEMRTGVSTRPHHSS